MASFAGGRSNALMPVALFNPFQKLDKPIMPTGAEAAAYKLWHQLSDERNGYLDCISDRGFERVNSAML